MNAKTEEWYGYIELNLYQQGWFVPHDIPGLIVLLVGNDDVGQMSAWYVLAASSIHLICLGDTKYEITSPVFDKVCMNLESGKQFRIVAKDNSSKDIYIQKMELNGVPHQQYTINYSTPINGGELVLYMGPSPR